MPRALFACVFVLAAGACGESSRNSAASGGAVGADAASGGAAGSDAASGGASSGGAGGLDLDGAVLEGSLEASTCALPTPDSQCDTHPQCGCELGEKCDVVELDSGRAGCTPAGEAKPHQACSTLGAQCVAGSSCLGGACKELCTTSADCAGPNRECRQVEIFSAGQAKKVPFLYACTAGCDPVSPGLVCGTGVSCLFTGAGTDCFASGGGTGPGGCTPTTGLACAPGFTCIDTTAQNGEHSCLKWCRLSASDCPSGSVCKELSSKPSLGGVEYGACFAN